jgi:hypothetical protein
VTGRRVRWRRNLREQELALLGQAVGARTVGPITRFGELAVELGQPGAVGPERLAVQDLAQVRLVHGGTRDRGGQAEGRDLFAWTVEQGAQVAEPLDLPHRGDVPVPADRPDPVGWAPGVPRTEWTAPARRPAGAGT